MNALGKMNALGIAVLGASLVFAGSAFAHGGGGGGMGGGSGFARIAPAQAAPAAFRPAAPAEPAKAPALRPGLMTTKAPALRPAAQRQGGANGLRELAWHGGIHGKGKGFRVGDRRHGRTFS